MEWFRQRIREAYGGRAPRVLDPFAGGGAIPLEAMRLGCLPEVLRAREILERGTSADRQLEVYAGAQAAGASEREAAAAVVDWLIEETMVGIAADAALTPGVTFDPTGGRTT